jgi:chromosome segregation ATPase
MLLLDQALHRQRDAAEMLEAEVSGLRSLLRETAALGQKAAPDIDLVREAAAEQRLAYGHDISTGKTEIAIMGEAIVGIGRSLGQLDNEVSRLKEVIGHLESKQEQLQEIVVRQGNEMTEIRQRNEELGGRVRQLEEEN